MSQLFNSNTWLRLVDGILALSTDNQATWTTIATGVVSAWEDRASKGSASVVGVTYQTADGRTRSAMSPTWTQQGSISIQSFLNAQNGGVQIQSQGSTPSLVSPTVRSQTYVKLVDGVLSVSKYDETNYAIVASGVTEAFVNVASTLSETVYKTAQGSYFRYGFTGFGPSAVGATSSLSQADYNFKSVAMPDVSIVHPITSTPPTPTPTPTPMTIDNIPVLSNLDLQGVNRVEGMIPSVANGQAVEHSQLTAFQTAVNSSVAQLQSVLASKVDSAQATTIANQIVSAAVAGLQTAAQVQTAIAAAIVGLNETMSVPVKRVYVGTRANVSTADLVQGDGNLEGLASSGILVDSPIAGESGIYYLDQSGNLVNHTATLISEGVQIGTWIWAETATEGTLAYRVVDVTPFSTRIVTSPAAYKDKSDNGVFIDPTTREIYLSIDPNQFAFDGQRRLVLASAIKSAIDLIPLLESELDSQSALISTIQTQVADQSAAHSLLMARVSAVEAENTAQAQTLVTLADTQTAQAGQIQTLGNRASALESGKADKSSFRAPVSFKVVNGVALNLDGTACSFVSMASNSSLVKGYYNITHNLGWMPNVSVYMINANGHPLLEAVAKASCESETVQQIALPKTGSYQVNISGGAGFF